MIRKLHLLTPSGGGCQHIHDYDGYESIKYGGGPDYY